MGGEPSGTYECPRCGSDDTWEVSLNVKPGVWHCSECNKDFKAWENRD